MSPLDHLMAQIGYLLLCWGWLEEELDQAIAKQARAKSKADDAQDSRMQFSGKLEQWRELQQRASASQAQQLSKVEEIYQSVTEARGVRNAICHGLKSASADPENAEAFVETSISGSGARYTLSELSDMVQQVDQVRHRIRRLTNAALAKN